MDLVIKTRRWYGTTCIGQINTVRIQEPLINPKKSAGFRSSKTWWDLIVWTKKGLFYYIIILKHITKAWQSSYFSLFQAVWLCLLCTALSFAKSTCAGRSFFISLSLLSHLSNFASCRRTRGWWCFFSSSLSFNSWISGIVLHIIAWRFQNTLEKM